MRIVIRADDKTARARARQLRATIEVTDSWHVDGPTLFAGAPIPWPLVPAGFKYLEHWDAACPLWRYGILAESLGTEAEREATRRVALDLRVPVFESGLLFVADTELGRRLVEVWRRECEESRDERLAFLRSLYIVKPRLCALPRSWLVEEHAAKIGKRSGRSRAQTLVQVQIGPNQFVKCKLGDEAAVQERFRKMRERRERRRRC